MITFLNCGKFTIMGNNWPRLIVFAALAFVIFGGCWRFYIYAHAIRHTKTPEASE